MQRGHGDSTAGETDVIGERIQVVFTAANSAFPLMGASKIRPIAVTSAQPSALTPGLPTMAASGLPGYESGLAVGAFAPAKTPDAIVIRLKNNGILRH